MDVDTLERKMFHEKERIKKEFLIKIKETKQNLLSMTEGTCVCLKNELFFSLYQSKYSYIYIHVNTYIY